MGAYAELYFDSTLMLSVKNGVPTDILSMLSDSERKVLTREQYEAALPFRKTEEEEDQESDGPDYLSYYYIYQTKASHIRDRLDLMGINLRVLNDLFDEAIKEHKELGSARFSNTDYEKLKKNYNLERGIVEDVDLYTFDYWLGLVKQSIESRVSLNDYGYDRFDFLKSDTFNWFSSQYGFPDYNLDLRYLFRILLEFVPDTNMITLDYTDLVWSEYEDPETLLCQNAIDYTTHDYSINERVILLTEGSSDIIFLKKSLELLYPHVSANFSFADFSAVKYQGGVASIITSLKVLISMSVKNRVIAIFDSDTAAADAIRGLTGVALPDNIKVMQLPEINFAKNYPTVGPTGNSNIDINGLACSTELYLPKEILRDESGHYFPVHWSGYVSGVGRYQGEISKKREIVQKFLAVTSSIESGAAKLEDFSWENMRAIFRAIFSKLAS